MEHLLGQLRRLDLQRRTILLFDYDGTLTPIVERPELAVLSPEMKELLARASRRHTIGIISGRSLADIKRLVKVEGIYYVGNHGFEISGPGVQLTKPEVENARPVLAEICEHLRAKLASIKGAIVEDKGLTLSVHYRLLAPKTLGKLKRIFSGVVKPYIDADTVVVTRGKKVLEVRPNVDWDKGKAVLWLIDIINPPKRTPLFYMGDDITDEDAFRALEGRAITVLVSGGRRRSRAKFFLKNVGEVKTFLERLVEG